MLEEGSVLQYYGMLIGLLSMPCGLLHTPIGLLSMHRYARGSEHNRVEEEDVGLLT